MPFVQVAENLVFSANSIAVVLPSVASGNAIAIGIYWNVVSGTLTSIDDDRSEPQAYIRYDHLDTGTQHGEIAYNYNVIGGTTTITATFSGVVDEAKIVVHEISGILQTDPIDGHTAAIDIANNSMCTDCLSSGSIMPTTSGCYIFGFISSSASPALNAGTGFTKRSGDNRGASEDLIQSIAASIAATFSRTDTTFSNSFIYVLALKPQMSGPTLPWLPVNRMAAGRNVQVIASGFTPPDNPT